MSLTWTLGVIQNLFPSPQNFLRVSIGALDFFCCIMQERFSLYRFCCFIKLNKAFPYFSVLGSTEKSFQFAIISQTLTSS